MSSLLDDPHAVPIAEAQAFYAGLPSEPRLIYRSDKEEWSPPSGPEAYRRKKQLRPVFNHPIVDVWNNDLAWKVVGILDAHKVSQCDIVEFSDCYAMFLGSLYHDRRCTFHTSRG
jgi:hypothetical protein